MKLRNQKARCVHLVLLAAARKVTSSVELRQPPPTTAAHTNNRMFLHHTECRSSSTTPSTGFRARHGSGVLASVLKLSQGAGNAREVDGQQSQPATTFLRRLRDCCSSRTSNTKTANSSDVRLRRGNEATSGRRRSTTTPATKSSVAGITELLHNIATVLKSGLAQSGTGMRRRGSTMAAVIVGVVCFLSVAAANTVSRPTGWASRRITRDPSSATAAVVSPPDAVGECHSRRPRILLPLSRGLGRRGKEREAGRNRLLKAPRFPLAYISWWKALKDRQQVGANAEMFHYYSSSTSNTKYYMRF